MDCEVCGIDIVHPPVFGTGVVVCSCECMELL
jgi:hypothetical protein